MVQPARHRQAPDDAPPLDPHAVERAYHLHRARRRARTKRQRVSRNAHFRFFVMLAVLFGLSVFVALTVWREIEQLFGL